jgi:hypothetical protein
MRYSATESDSTIDVVYEGGVGVSVIDEWKAKRTK